MLQFGYRSVDVPAGERSPGERWLPYSPIIRRPKLTWPGGARLALWVCPNVLHYESDPPADPLLEAWPRMPQPDVMAFGRQDFAARVGFWRVLEVLDRFPVRCTAVVNSAALLTQPDVCAAARERRWGMLGHGICNTRFVHALPEAQERAYWRAMREQVQRAVGVELIGTGGPGPQSATVRTMDLLAEEGFLWHGDWFCDDQPVPLQVRSGRMISLPYAQDTNDAPFLGTAFESDDFVDVVRRQFDRLYLEGADSGRVMCISIHPALIGQAHRIGHLQALLEYVCGFPGVWHATGDEIARHYLEHFDEAVRGSIGEAAG